MSAVEDRMINVVRQTVNQRALTLSRKECKITVRELGVRAGTIGAAAYAYNKISTV